MVNIYGFIKYSSIHEGNFSDPKDLNKVIQALDNNRKGQKPVIVLDAGIATNQNLKLIRTKGYHYLCVSRQKIKNYQYDPQRLVTLLETKSKQEIRLAKILTTDNTDYVIEVKSPQKAKKESSIKTQFEIRFEEELEKIKSSLNKKGGVKTIDKVNQRIGRAKQKYPSVQGRYQIDLNYDDQKINVIHLAWSKKEKLDQQTQEDLGKYFIRTSMDMKDELIVWNVYTTIREIENTFRKLKADLDLRPIYHKNDESTVAHLNLGLLAYWIANTIRCQLKANGIHSCWKEIVRIGNTQKVITTSGYNKANEEISVRKCSEPEQKLKDIQAALNIKSRHFTKLKSVVHKLKPKNQNHPIFRELLSG